MSKRTRFRKSFNIIEQLSGARGLLSQALRRSKGGFTKKIHLITHALGNPLDFTLTPGQIHDIKEALPLLQDQFGEKMINDWR